MKVFYKGMTEQAKERWIAAHMKYVGLKMQYNNNDTQYDRKIKDKENKLFRDAQIKSFEEEAEKMAAFKAVASCIFEKDMPVEIKEAELIGVDHEGTEYQMTEYDVRKVKTYVKMGIFGLISKVADIKKEEAPVKKKRGRPRKTALANPEE